MASVPARLAVGDRLSTFTREVLIENMVEFENVVWQRGVNSHSDPDEAKKDGLTKPLASGQNQMAFLHEMLERNFGDSWVYGGRISTRYIKPVYAGDRLTPNGTVTEITAEDKPRVVLEIWCENQDGEKTAVGTASIEQPSSTRSWLGHAEAAS